MLYFEDLVNTLELKAPDKEIALIFCGDFNCFPSNGVLELMRKQHIPTDHKDWTSSRTTFLFIYLIAFLALCLYFGLLECSNSNTYSK